MITDQLRDFLLIFVGISDIVLALFVSTKNIKLNKIFSFFVWAIAIAIWTFLVYFFLSAKTFNNAYFWINSIALIVVVLGIALYQLALSFRYDKFIVYRKKVFLSYFLVPLFALCYFIPNFYIKDILFHDWGKENVLGIGFYIVYAVFAIYVIMAVLIFINTYLKSSGHKKNQLKYIMISIIPTLILGTFFNWFLVLIGNYQYIWVGPLCTFIMVIITFIAIIKHQLMDIRLAISRTVIFLLIYVPILLAPFLFVYYQHDIVLTLFGSSFWIIAMVVECILTLLGLLAYRFFEKKAERKILQEEYQHERAIKQLTKELITIETREALIQKIIHDAKQAANLTSVSLFLHDEREGSMSLHVSSPLAEEGNAETTCASLEQAISFSPNHPILNYLKQKQDIVLAEELQRSIPDNVSILHQLNAVALVPIMEKSELLGCILLGEKTNTRVFTQIELLAFKVLAYQIGMQLISITHMEQVKQDIINRESEKATHLQNIIAGISHNLKTPIMSSAGGVSIINDLIKDLGENEQTKEIASWTSDIQENLDYMNNILNGVKQQITQQQTEDQKPYPLQELIEKITTLMTHEITQNKCTLIIKNEVDPSVKISQNINDLLQVLNVLISNAVDSYQGKGGEVKLIFSQEENNFQIKIQDQGKGIPEKVQPSIFKKMVTTKGKHGRGLGLYLIYPIVKGRLNGDITFESIEGKGTKFTLNL